MYEVDVRLTINEYGNHDFDKGRNMYVSKISMIILIRDLIFVFGT